MSYAVIEFALESQCLPKAMLKDLRARAMQLLMSLPDSSQVASSAKICRYKIRFYTHLHNGNRIAARRAVDRLRVLFNEELDVIMFGTGGTCVVVGARGIQHQSDKQDHNADTMGRQFMAELGRFERMLTCRVG